MACRQWNPCTPCSTTVPYPCPASQNTSTGPTGPAQNGPTSWFFSQLSATNNTIPIQITPSQVTGLNVWQLKSGNTDGRFNLQTGAYSVPYTGVYTISFQGAVVASAIGTNTITTAIYSGGLAQVTQVSTNTASAIGDTFPVSVNATLSLTKGATVQIYASGNITGWNWASQLYPTAGPTAFSIKSEF